MTPLKMRTEKKMRCDWKPGHFTGRRGSTQELIDIWIVNTSTGLVFVRMLRLKRIARDAGACVARGQTLLLRRIRRRNLGVAGRGGFEIGRGRSFGVADGPANSACENIEGERVLPVFGAIADGRVKRSAATIHASP